MLEIFLLHGIINCPVLKNNKILKARARARDFQPVFMAHISPISLFPDLHFTKVYC